MPADLYATSGGGGGGGTTVATAPDLTPYRGQATAVPVNAETIVVQRIVPLGYTMKLYSIVPGGNADSEWFLYADGVEVLRFRRNVGNMEPMKWGGSLPFAAGTTVTLKVAHQSVEQIAGSTTRNFYGTLLARDE